MVHELSSVHVLSKCVQEEGKCVHMFSYENKNLLLSYD